MTRPTPHRVEVDGQKLYFESLGEGMPVVLCHGFPTLGYAWRHQMRAIADAGYRVIALDLPRYGGSDAPAAVEAYGHAAITRTLLGLLDALDAERAVFAGQDFGAPAAWNVALRAPERVRGLIIMSVPFENARAPLLPSRGFAKLAERHFFHVHYFQEPGVAEAELDPRAHEFLARVYHALSGGYRYLDTWKPGSAGAGYLDVLPEAPPLPWSWLDEAELEHFAAVFARTGFRGGLQWYRAFDVNHREADAPFGAPLEVPTLFIAGAGDPVIEMRGERALAQMRANIPDLRGEHILDGAGHWVQQEQPGAVNALLSEFLLGLR